jgi:hypothetical protein
MYFEPEDVAEFEAASDLLVRRCDSWARSEGVVVDTFSVSAALDFRHRSPDGRLGLWTAAMVREFLLDWLPRHLSVTADKAAEAPESLRALLRYLRHTDLDDPAGDPLPVLEEAVTDAVLEFDQAMSDERNFGPAKFWMMTAITAGVDPADDAAMQRFIDGVERGEIVYDADGLRHIMDRQLEDSASRERTLPVPPISIAPKDELARSAGGSRVVHQLRAFAEWVGSGRQLTATGQLKLVDARVLVDLLDTGDVVDPVVGKRTFRTTTSAELRGLTTLVEWARRIRLIRVVKNRLVTVAKFKPLLDDSLALWLKAFETVVDLDDVLFPPNTWHGSMLAEAYDVLLPDVLNTTYGLPAPIPLVRLEESVWHACHEMFAIDAASELAQDLWREGIGRDLRRVLQLLADLGAVDLTSGIADPIYSLDLQGPDDQPEPYSLSPAARQRIRTALGGTTELVMLTALGVKAVRSQLLAAGRHAPLVGELSAASAGQLLGQVAEHYTPDTGREEINGWLAAHPSDGEDQLLDAIRGCPFRTRAAAMLDVLTATQPDENRRLRRLRTDPTLAPTAIQLLISSEQLAMDDLTDTEGLIGMTEQVLQLLELAGPDAVREQLAATPDPTELVYALANSQHPDAAGLNELRALVLDPMLGQGRGHLRAVGGDSSQPASRQHRRSKRKRNR